MNRSTIETDIPMNVKCEVWERDEHRCILCGSGRASPNAHFIPRSALGLGIEENIVTLCLRCHDRFDNSAERKLIREEIRRYLKSKYPNWDESKLVYRKYGEIEDFYKSLNQEQKDKVLNYIEKLKEEK